MTSKKLMKEIAKRAKDIGELYHSVYPEGDYLVICIRNRKDCVSFNNENWKGGKDEKYPIDYYETEMFIRMNGKFKEKKWQERN